MDPMGYAMKLPFAVKQGEQKPIDDQKTWSARRLQWPGG